MHVDASPKGERSSSRRLSTLFVERLGRHMPDLAVDYLDLALEPIGHVTGAFAAATYTPAAERTDEMKAVLAPSDRLCARVLAADALLFALPMYNFSIPSGFKAFIDALVRTDITYVQAPDGGYVGQLAGKRVLFITTRGADLRPGTPFAHMDALTPSLRAAFGFIGVTEPLFVDAQPLQFADQDARAAALERAEAELAAIAIRWGPETTTADRNVTSSS